MIEELEKKISDLIKRINGPYPDPATQIKELSQALLHLRQAEYWKRAAELDIETEDE